MGKKLKITEKQWDGAIYAMLAESTLLSEAEQLTKSDVEQIAKKSIKSYMESGRNVEMENRVKTIIHQMVKNDKQLEDAVVQITRNVLVQLYKSLWTKKSFWVSDLKNSSN